MRVSRWIALAALGLWLGPAAAEQRPNILFILADDQRNDMLGCAGHPVVKTPNIDSLAADGVRFENAFVTTSICMASRACIFTGLTETGHGYTGGGAPASPVLEIDVDTSFAALLRRAGYRTGFFGKQHVKFQEGGKQALGRMFDKYEVIWRAPYFKEQPDGSKRHSAELIGDRSVAFLESQSKEQPFCLYMSFNIAHAEDHVLRPGSGHFPWPKAVDGLYDDVAPPGPRLGDPRFFDALPTFLQESLNRERWHWRWDSPEKYAINMRAYWRMLTGMDRVLGRVLQTLEQRKLAANTVVIYSADNGYYMGDRGLAGKWSHYEQSLRVPLIIYDPRLPPAQRGRVVDPLALNTDLPAYMLELAGVEVPAKYQGRSLLPIVAGETPDDWRREFYCEHRMNHESIPRWRGVRGERFVYACYDGQNPPYEFLHDLQNDPDQFTNLAGDASHQATLERMRGRCLQYANEYGRPEVAAYKHQRATARKRER